MILDILLIGTGMIIGNGMEWCIHKWVLHGLGKKKNSFFHHHWEHHRECRRGRLNGDSSYSSLFTSMMSKEGFGLLFLAVITYPMSWLSMTVYIGMLIQLVLYFVIHRWIHMHPEYASFLFPWHDKHHIVDQNSSWCVTYPLWDKILGTTGKK